MKFGKSLMKVVETSDPEWGPYWINYKFLKKKINEISEAKGGIKITDQNLVSNPGIISKSSCEVEFFRLLKKELKKTSDFFTNTEEICRIRKERIWKAYTILSDTEVLQDRNSWTRLLMACVKFYKDVLLLENFAIMNYCGFSKILKKHDKLTGFVTRDAFMRNVMSQENFTHYPHLMDLIKESEKLFEDIQRLESAMPLQAEERLFIEAMRDLNQQASRMQDEEKKESVETNGSLSNTQSCHPTALPSSGSRSSDEDDSNHGINQLSSGTTKHHVHHLPSAVAAATTVWDKNNSISMSAALVHAATNTLVDAASRLNNSNNKLNKDASPSLENITSWTKIPSKTVDTGGVSTLEGIMGNKKRPYFSAGLK